MLLRDHPLMTYRGLHNWPPVWSCTDGRNQHPKAKSERSRRFFGLIRDHLIVAFYLFHMKDQSILAVSYLMTKRSVAK